jgi:hypothetical protein
MGHGTGGCRPGRPGSSAWSRPCRGGGGRRAEGADRAAGGSLSRPWWTDRRASPREAGLHSAGRRHRPGGRDRHAGAAPDPGRAERDRRGRRARLGVYTAVLALALLPPPGSAAATATRMSARPGWRSSSLPRSAAALRWRAACPAGGSSAGRVSGWSGLLSCHGGRRDPGGGCGGGFGVRDRRWSASAGPDPAFSWRDLPGEAIVLPGLLSRWRRAANGWAPPTAATGPPWPPAVPRRGGSGAALGIPDRGDLPGRPAAGLGLSIELSPRRSRSACCRLRRWSHRGSWRPADRAIAGCLLVAWWGRPPALLPRPRRGGPSSHRSSPAPGWEWLSRPSRAS